MKSILHCHSAALPLPSQVLQKQHLKPPKLLWGSPSGREPTKLILHGQSTRPPLPVRTDAFTSLVLGATSPAKTGDMTVILQIGALLLFVYWIANFVVPNFIMKDLQSKKVSEDQTNGAGNVPRDGK